MIGTTLKLGFDGKAAITGLNNVSNIMGRMGRQVGIGALRKAGEGVTDMIGKIVTAIPGAISQFRDLNGELYDMSRTFGVPIEKLMQMRETFRLAGTDVDDATRSLAIFGKNLQTAATDGGDVGDMLDKVFGVQGAALYAFNPGADIVDKMRAVFNAINSGSLTIEERSEAMMTIFGRSGTKFMATMSDPKAWDEAKNNVGKLAKSISDTASASDDADDAWGRWKNSVTEFGKIFSDALDEIFGGANGVDDMFNRMDVSAIKPLADELAKLAKTTLNFIIAPDLLGRIKKIFSDAGDSIYNSIRDSIKKGIEDGVNSSFNAIKSQLGPRASEFIFGSDKNAAPKPSATESGMRFLNDMLDSIGLPSLSSATLMTDDEIVAKLDDQTNVLKDIRSNIGTATFA